MRTYSVLAMLILTQGLGSAWADIRLPKQCHSDSLPRGEGSDLTFDAHGGGRAAYEIDMKLSLPRSEVDPFPETEYYDHFGPIPDSTESAPVEFSWSGGSGPVEPGMEQLGWSTIELVGLTNWQTTHQITVITEGWKNGQPDPQSYGFTCSP